MRTISHSAMSFIVLRKREMDRKNLKELKDVRDFSNCLKRMAAQGCPGVGHIINENKET